MAKLTNPFCLMYVHVHNEHEEQKVRETLDDLGITWSSDFGELSKHKWTCEACGNEVRDHGADGTCP